MNIDILKAIPPLTGVIIGGMITVVSTTWRENIIRARVVKQAARLIDADLDDDVEATIVLCLRKKVWGYEDVPLITVQGWQENRGIIAAELSYQAWAAVRIAVIAANQFRDSRNMEIKSGSIQISDAAASQLIPMLNDIKDGRKAIHRLVAG